MDWIIRNAESKDLEVVAKSLSRLMGQHYEYDSFYEPSVDMLDRFREWVGKNIESEDGLVLVAEKDSSIIGTLNAEILLKPAFFKHSRYGYIAAVRTLQDCRQTGVMDSLCKKSYDWFREQGIKYIEADVHLDNKESLNFTEKKQGFKPYKMFFRKEL